MNLYHIQPSAYGTFGSIVIAESSERAIDLFRGKYPEWDDRRVTAEILTVDLAKEYVQPEMVW